MCVRLRGVRGRVERWCRQPLYPQTAEAQPLCKPSTHGHLWVNRPCRRSRRRARSVDGRRPRDVSAVTRDPSAPDTMVGSDRVHTHRNPAPRTRRPWHECRSRSARCRRRRDHRPVVAVCPAGARGDPAVGGAQDARADDDGPRRRSYLVVAGLVASFTGFPLTGTLALAALPVPPTAIHRAGLAALLLLGVGLIVPRVEGWLETPFSGIPQRWDPRGTRWLRARPGARRRLRPLRRPGPRGDRGRRRDLEDSAPAPSCWPPGSPSAPASAC